jgi:hypothetical protein
MRRDQPLAFMTGSPVSADGMGLPRAGIDLAADVEFYPDGSRQAARAANSADRV